MSIDLLNQLYDKMSVYGDTYGNTQEDINANILPIDIARSPQESSDSTGIAPIILPAIPPIINQGDNNEENINKNINYDNLIVRNQNAGTGIDSDPNIIRIANFDEMFGDKKFTNEIGDFKGNTNLTVENPERFNFPEDKKTGILETLKTKGSDLLSRLPSVRLLTAVLPKQDPRGTALRNFYGDNFDLTSSGSVASGIMKGYNPVSGGFLNLVTGGKYGDETQYGLTPAIDKRMDNIKNMLDKKHSDYLKETGIKNFSSMDDEEFEKFMKSIEGRKLFRYGIKGHTSAAENYFKLKSLKEAQEKVKEKEYQDRIAREADTAARARAANAAVYASADKQGFTNNQGGFSTSAADKAGTSEGSGQFSSKSGKGRTGYGKGGIVTL